MPIEYRIDIDEDGREIIKDWQRKTPDLHRLIMQRFVSKLVGLSQDRAGKVLNVITGRLRNSVFGEVDARSTGSVGAGSNVEYAPPHEFGVNKTVTVKSHTRTSSAGAPFRVASYRMHMNIPARPFVAPTIDEFFRLGAHERIAEGAFREHKRRFRFE